MRWLIATPAWGERCIHAFLFVALPAIRAALGNRPARFVVHTDQPARIAAAMQGVAECLLMRPSPGKTHEVLGDAHRDALQLAELGEAVAFINADMVPSIEVFAAAERRFMQGKRLIMMAATRTRTIGDIPPIAATSADLLRWTMAHRHPAVAECFWGSGHTGTPWAIYFTRGDDVVLHGFHLHPFAVLSDSPLWFTGKTIDSDLVERFTADQMHLVTDANEAAFAEMSPPERVFPPLRFNQCISVRSIAFWAQRHALQRHRDLFRHRIAIVGSGRDIGDGDVVERILTMLGPDDHHARRAMLGKSNDPGRQHHRA